MKGIADFGTCDVCGETVTGSHYHCPCGTTDVTSMMGHHRTSCSVTGRNERFHHCGPDGDCELALGGDR